MRYISDKESFENYMERFVKIFYKDEQYVIWGSAFKAGLVREKIPNILFYVDNDAKKWETDLDGLKIKSPEALKEFPDVKVIVAVGIYIDIYEQLRSYGIPEENYCSYHEMLMIRDVTYTNLTMPTILRV